jgi:hypothetical protein
MEKINYSGSYSPLTIKLENLSENELLLKALKSLKGHGTNSPLNRGKINNHRTLKNSIKDD